MTRARVPRQVQILAINLGTQAEHHPELHPGLVLIEVCLEGSVTVSFQICLYKVLVEAPNLVIDLG